MVKTYYTFSLFTLKELKDHDIKMKQVKKVLKKEDVMKEIETFMKSFIKTLDIIDNDIEKFKHANYYNNQEKILENEALEIIRDLIFGKFEELEELKKRLGE